jgi:HlyD family secretion protein
MEAELRKLQIDRVSTSTRPARRMGRWATLLGAACALASVALFAYSRIGAPAVVEVYRVPPRHAAGPAGPDIILAATGYIIALYKIEVAAKVSGKVAWIGGEKGDRVQHGQELVRLEDPEYRGERP